MNKWLLFTGLLSLGISLIASDLFKLKRIANIKCRNTAVPYEAV